MCPAKMNSIFTMWLDKLPISLQSFSQGTTSFLTSYVYWSELNTHACTHACTHHTHAHTHTRMHNRHVHTHTHATHPCHACMHARTYAHTYTHIRTHTHTPHARTHAHTRTHTHTHTHTHTGVPLLAIWVICLTSVPLVPWCVVAIRSLKYLPPTVSHKSLNLSLAVISLPLIYIVLLETCHSQRLGQRYEVSPCSWCYWQWSVLPGQWSVLPGTEVDDLEM